MVADNRSIHKWAPGEQPLGGRSSCPVRQQVNRPVADSSSYWRCADRHIDMHAYRVDFTANESARDGDRLGGLAGYADAYQVRAGNQTVGRVVFDTASAGQIDAAPSIRASAAAGLISNDLAGVLFGRRGGIWRNDE